MADGLFYCKIGLQHHQRTPGTDICLNCPLPEGYCVNGDMNTSSIRNRFNQDYAPTCLVAATCWHGITLEQGEELARQILNADDPRSADRFRAAMVENERIPA